MVRTPRVTVELPEAVVVLRRAEQADVPSLVRLLAADPLGSSRDGVDHDDDLAPYWRAYQAIEADPAQVLLAAEHEDEIVGTAAVLHPRSGPARRSTRADRSRSCDERYRSRGLGAAMFEWAIAEARRRGCTLVQLTTDKTRADAHRFYERLGFVSSHEGLKLVL